MVDALCFSRVRGIVDVFAVKDKPEPSAASGGVAYESFPISKDGRNQSILGDVIDLRPSRLNLFRDGAFGITDVIAVLVFARVPTRVKVGMRVDTTSTEVELKLITAPGAVDCIISPFPGRIFRRRLRRRSWKSWNFLTN